MDAMLLRRFPGRTLEEIDRANWPRLARALAAQTVLDIEDVRERYHAQLAKPTRAQWRAILRHDELLGVMAESDETEMAD